MMVPTGGFDFDVMVALAKDDPLEFSRRRDELIRLAIESSATREAAESVQREIDADLVQFSEAGAGAAEIMARGLRAMVERISVGLEGLVLVTRTTVSD